MVAAADLVGNAPGGRRGGLSWRRPSCPSRRPRSSSTASSCRSRSTSRSGTFLELDRIPGMEAAYAGTSFVRPEDRGRLRYGSPAMSVAADATTPWRGWARPRLDDEGAPPSGSRWSPGRGRRVPDQPGDGGPVRRWVGRHGPTAGRHAAHPHDQRAPSPARAARRADRRHPRRAAAQASTAPGRSTTAGSTSSSGSRRSGRSRAAALAGCTATPPTTGGRRSSGVAGRRLRAWRPGSWGVPNCGKGQPFQNARVGHGAALPGSGRARRGYGR